MKHFRAYVACLFHAQVFETVFAYYLLSSGEIYAKETKNAAKDFLKSYAYLKRIDKRFGDPDFLKTGKNPDLRTFIRDIRNWANSDKVLIYGGWAEYAFVPVILMEIKVQILRVLRIGRVNFSWSSTIVNYNSEAIKWKGHLPRQILPRKEPLVHLIKQASASPSITLVGDIRRSQELMTYTPQPSEYARRMSNFMSETKRNVLKHGGIFDKFTGDGFIAFFNAAICKEVKVDFIDATLAFVKDELVFAKPFFEDWCKLLRKQPVERIGLAIGADIGIVNFEHFEDHFVAVGESSVWATRMASLAKADQIVLNNILANDTNISANELQ